MVKDWIRLALWMSSVCDTDCLDVMLLMHWPTTTLTVHVSSRCCFITWPTERVFCCDPRLCALPCLVTLLVICHQLYGDVTSDRASMRRTLHTGISFHITEWHRSHQLSAGVFKLVHTVVDVHSIADRIAPHDSLVCLWKAIDQPIACLPSVEASFLSWMIFAHRYKETRNGVLCLCCNTDLRHECQVRRSKR